MGNLPFSCFDKFVTSQPIRAAKEFCRSRNSPIRSRTREITLELSIPINLAQFTTFLANDQKKTVAVCDCRRPLFVGNTVIVMSY